MNISIPGPMRDWVQSRVETGAYAGASDYVRELIRRDQQELSGGARWLADVDTAVARGLADAEAGRMTAAEDVFNRLGAKYAEMARERENP